MKPEGKLVKFKAVRFFFCHINMKSYVCMGVTLSRIILTDIWPVKKILISKYSLGLSCLQAYFFQERGRYEIGN